MREFGTNKTLIEDITARIEKGGSPSVEEAGELLQVDPTLEHDVFAEVVRLSRELKSNYFQQRVFSIAPLYVTSICQERCVYCNFRSENKNKEIERIRLSDEQLVGEVQFLAKKGLRTIELVYATDSAIKSSDVARHITIVRKILEKYGGGLVGINSRPYSTDQYHELKASGLDFAVLWQETFVLKAYGQYHPGNTEKTDFAYRVSAQQRMIDGGILNIGCGVLSGLADWRNDWFALIKHVRTLVDLNTNNVGTIILGIPRLKPAAGALLQTTPHIPTDKEFVFAISVFNLLFPKALPFINTRENWELCVEIAKGGGALFTFDCRTIPGGYSLGRHGYQFPTNDFHYDQYSSMMTQYGLKVHPIWNT